MRVLLASEYFYPVSKGGTEVYVYQLAKELIKNGHECLVVSLSDELKSFVYDDIQIKYIPFEVNAYNEIKNPRNIDALIKIAKDFNPDIFHMHTYTSSMGLVHLLKMKELGIKIIFTSHLPNLTCLRGDLMRFGHEVCDGIAIKEKCMNCYLHSTGINKELNRKILIELSKFGWAKKLISRLNQFDVKSTILKTFKKREIPIVVVSKWQKNILELNGFASNNINVCRQAITQENIVHLNKERPAGKLRIGFIGRIVKVKGLHLLIDALSELDTDKFELNIVAIKSKNELDYYHSMKSKAKLINANWMEDLESSAVFNFIDNIDLLAIPSIWLETGPIVAFEALARKVPVLAFNYGGVKELTNENESFLVENSEEMKIALNKIMQDELLLQNKSNNINFHRSTTDLYLETIELYNKI